MIERKKMWFGECLIYYFTCLYQNQCQRRNWFKTPKSNVIEWAN